MIGGINPFYNNSFEIDNYLDQLKEKKSNIMMIIEKF